MRIVLQRVTGASVTIGGKLHSSIGPGLLALVGVRRGDTADDVCRMAAKAMNMRIFNDANGVMNLSLLQTGGELLAVSQFTLLASTRRGNRPSYIEAAGHDVAVPLYELFCSECARLTGKPTQTGVFGADMEVALVNDGPVTIVLDSE
ncbi:MAG: D-aminoacyl-tRNA deacylase [Muribaculaceae bacterium]|nr:D-aminoacyl-tRNA deacylase [Muribaculaceae bacterium]